AFWGLVWHERHLTSPDVLLHAERGFAGDKLNRFLLGVLGVDLHDGQIGGTRSQRLDHYAEKGSGAVHARSVGLPGSGNNRLAVFLVHALHESDLLRSPREEAAVANLLDADNCG